MEILKAIAYAGFGLLMYKIASAFLSNFFPVLAGIVGLSLLFWAVEVLPGAIRRGKKNKL
ncbi:hypothetical protein LCGC14_1322140 [marine sediment metagenome]|uniref:Uncharacterized protein n=1 Tax=marine sediment metagenome TaxID=412755 RepID=A0A0F9KJ69_9ZZZZ